MDYLVADSRGTQHITERHEMTLFPHQAYVEALQAAGLEVQLDIGGGPTGRGLVTGRLPGSRPG